MTSTLISSVASLVEYRPPANDLMKMSQINKFDWPLADSEDPIFDVQGIESYIPHSRSNIFDIISEFAIGDPIQWFSAIRREVLGSPHMEYINHSSSFYQNLSRFNVGYLRRDEYYDDIAAISYTANYIEAVAILLAFSQYGNDEDWPQDPIAFNEALSMSIDISDMIRELIHPCDCWYDGILPDIDHSNHCDTLHNSIVDYLLSLWFQNRGIVGDFIPQDYFGGFFGGGNPPNRDFNHDYEDYLDQINHLNIDWEDDPYHPLPIPTTIRTDPNDTRELSSEMTIDELIATLSKVPSKNSTGSKGKKNKQKTQIQLNKEARREQKQKARKFAHIIEKKQRQQARDLKNGFSKDYEELAFLSSIAGLATPYVTSVLTYYASYRIGRFLTSPDELNKRNTLATCFLSLLHDTSKVNIVLNMSHILTLCGYPPSTLAQDLYSVVLPILKVIGTKLPSGSASSAQQLPTAESYEECADIVSSSTLNDISSFFEDVMQYDYISTLAALSAGAAALIACLLVGKQSIKSLQSDVPFLLKMARAGKDIAMGSSGLRATISIVKDFSTWVKSIVEYWVMGKTPLALLTFIQSSPIDDVTEDQTAGRFELKKSDVINYISYLSNPANRSDIIASKERQAQLDFSYSIVTDIQARQFKGDITLSTPISTSLSHLVKDLRALKSIVEKEASDEHFRETPFWIYLTGKPGLGKSMLMTKIAKTMLEALKPWSQEIGLSSGKEIYSVNFSDKYLSLYNSEFCLTIDDLFQDRDGSMEESSALKIISWVSCVPHTTNQAAVEDKGKPFVSKLIISTSNDEQPTRPMEIVSPEALNRRMAVKLRIVEKNRREWTNGSCELLPNTKLQVKWLGETDYSDIAFSTLCYQLTKNFLKHFRQQKKLRESRNPDQETVEYIRSRIRDEMQSSTEECSLTEGVINKISSLASPWYWFADVVNDGLLSAGVDKERILRDREYAYAYGLKMGFLHVHRDSMKIPRLFVEHDGLLGGLTPQENIFYQDLCAYYNSQTEEQYARQNLPYVTPEEYFRQFRHVNWFDTMKAKYNDWWDKAWQQICLHPVWTMLIFSVSACGAYNLFQKYSTSAACGASSTLACAYSMNKAQHAKGPRVIHIRNATECFLKEYESEFYSDTLDSNAFSLAQDVIIGRGGICQLKSFKDGTSATASGIRIGNRFVLFNLHFADLFTVGGEFHITYPNPQYGMKIVKQKFDPKRLYRIPGKDAVVYRCDASMPSARNIVKHFPYDQIPANPTAAVTVTESNGSAILTSNLHAKPHVYKYRKHTGEEIVCAGFEVNHYFQRGQSGSPLIAVNTQVKEKIMGILVCRDTQTNMSYFSTITQDDITRASEHLHESLDPLEHQEEFEQALSTETLSSEVRNLQSDSLVLLGKVPKKHMIKQITSTQLRTSCVHDPASSKMQPSVLRDSDQRMDPSIQGQSVMLRNLAGYDTPYGAIDTATLDRVVDEMSQFYISHYDKRGIPAKVLDDFQMVNGIPGLLKPLDMKTSPGLPYIHQRVKTNLGGKYEWFEEEQDLSTGRKLYTMRPNLAVGFEQQVKQLERGERPIRFGYVCLKDEKRSIEKIRTGKTRTFICLPMDYNLQVRKYFGAFTAVQHAFAGQFASSVGIDPVVHWPSIYRRLLTKNSKWEDFDYKNWDQSLHPEFFRAFASTVNRWYGVSDTSPSGKARHVLMEELYRTYLIAGSLLLVKTGGQCSGCAITAEVNCIIHDMLMYYCWLKSSEKQPFDVSTWDSYRDNVELCVYGDDIVISITDRAREFFNGNAIQLITTELGMNITAADKTMNFRLKNPSEITFLKRSFIDEDTRILCPIDKTVIEEIPMWIRRKDSDVAATVTNCECALREAYMYGEQYFTTLRDKLTSRLKERLSNSGFKAGITVSYQYFDQEYRKGLYKCIGFDDFEESVGWITEDDNISSFALTGRRAD